MTLRVAALALIAYALHFAWEMAQAKWFATMTELPFWTATAWCARAAGWDVAISAAAYLAASAVVRRWRWVRPLSWVALAIYLAAGLAVTSVIEWSALAKGRWRYAPEMMTVEGVGILPLLQWMVVPVVILAVARASIVGSARMTGYAGARPR